MNVLGTLSEDASDECAWDRFQGKLKHNAQRRNRQKQSARDRFLIQLQNGSKTRSVDPTRPSHKPFAGMLRSKTQKAKPAEQPGWTIASWLTSLHLLDIISDALLNKSEADADADADEVTCMKGLSDQAIEAAVDAAAVALKTKLKDAAAALRKTKAVDARQLNQKFAADGSSFTFQYGSMKEYHAGLEGLIGNPDPRVGEMMAWEHANSPYSTKAFVCWWCGETTAAAEYKYIATQPANEEDTKNGCRERGRDGWTLQHFIDQCNERFPTAKLTKEEVIALRLYTGPMFVWYNHVLRWLRQGIPYDDALLKKGESWSSWHEQRKYPAHWPNTKNAEEMLYVPFRTTIHVLNSAIIKLSRTQKARKVYRGTKGGVLPQQFWTPNHQNVRGGIELGFMSTTTDRKVALGYAKSEDTPSVVFEMQMGMVDRGAPLKWCSQFPLEEEILFAPLTGLEVVGIPKVEDSAIIVELRLNCNLHDLTIEQILAKMQKVSMYNIICDICFVHVGVCHIVDK
jgi:hypothetical protein